MRPCPANFGTGAVKITPAHDPNDFMTGKRHNLEFINMLTEDGLVNEEGGDEFKGMKRFTARKAVIAALDKAGVTYNRRRAHHRARTASRRVAVPSLVIPVVVVVVVRCGRRFAGDDKLKFTG